MIKVVQNHLEFIELYDNFLSCNESGLNEIYNSLGKDRPINNDSMKFYWSDPAAFKSCYITYIQEKNLDIKSFLWWLIIHNEKSNKKTLLEYFWVSFNKKHSIKLFKHGLNYAKNNYFDRVEFNNSLNNKKLERFAFKNNFKLNAPSYYITL